MHISSYFQIPFLEGVIFTLTEGYNLFFKIVWNFEEIVCKSKLTRQQILPRFQSNKRLRIKQCVKKMSVNTRHA